MAQQNRGRADDADAAGTETADLVLLRAQLNTSGRSIEHYAGVLKDGLTTYKDGLGKHAKPVLDDIELLSRVVREELAAMKQLHLTSAAGRNARALVLETLVALEGWLSHLHRMYSTRDKAVVKHALSEAKASRKRCERLRVEASHALGYTWRL
jgi:hypothetical protein